MRAKFVQVGLIRFELRYSKCIQHPRLAAATRAARIARIACTARATRTTRATRVARTARATRTARAARAATCTTRPAGLARTREDTYV